MSNLWEHLGIDGQSQLDDIYAEIEGKYPEVPFPKMIYKDALHRGIGGRTEIPGREALVIRDRNDAEWVTGICSPEYMVIPHQWAVWRFENALKEMPQFGNPKIDINLYSDGAKLRVNATFPEVEIKVGGKEPINPRAGIKNSYDLSMEWEAFFGAMVLRCTNGLMMFKKISNGGGKHRMSLDLEANVSQLQSGMQKLDEQYGIWNRWMEIQMKEDQAMEMLETSPLSDKQIENVLELPELGTHDSIKQWFEKKKPISGWFLNSIVTQYMEHEMDNTPSRMYLEERWTNHLHTKLK